MLLFRPGLPNPLNPDDLTRAAGLRLKHIQLPNAPPVFHVLWCNATFSKRCFQLADSDIFCADGQIAAFIIPC
ncbi:hypothetical protein [Motiliproteus sp. SC1-56]|uniref:hypothetical protein n=1 Tax=Motiliproteus sp. SC1-56 TaxID=2799565 RepID=UPI001A8D8C80|nr:hypothetical protein [Motiliproteus sp. SC1-56]